VLGESEYDSWDEFVASQPEGSIYASAEYLDILCSSAGGSFRIVVVENSSRIVGGIGLYEVQTRWGCMLRPRLLLQYIPVLVNPGDSIYPSHRTSTVLAVQQELTEFLAAQKYASAVLKNRWPSLDFRCFTAAGWTSIPTYTYVVPLADLAGQWNCVDRNFRRLIRKAKSENIVFSDDDEFDEFYDLHSGLRERKPVPVYLPRDAFASWYRRLRQKGLVQLFHARDPAGKSLASQLVLLGRHSVSHTVCACGDPSAQRSGINAFLRWAAFERLSESGYTGNDLTDASLNSVTAFKSQFGGELQLCLALEARESRLFRFGSRVESIARPLVSRIRRAGDD
jgi:hypothetical protein